MDLHPAGLPGRQLRPLRHRQVSCPAPLGLETLHWWLTSHRVNDVIYSIALPWEQWKSKTWQPLVMNTLFHGFNQHLFVFKFINSPLNPSVGFFVLSSQTKLCSANTTNCLWWKQKVLLMLNYKLKLWTKVVWNQNFILGYPADTMGLAWMDCKLVLIPHRVLIAHCYLLNFKHASSIAQSFQESDAFESLKV